jgi:hypothetical protein
MLNQLARDAPERGPRRGRAGRAVGAHRARVRPRSAPPRRMVRSAIVTDTPWMARATKLFAWNDPGRGARVPGRRARASEGLGRRRHVGARTPAAAQGRQRLSAWVPVGCLNPRGFPVKAGESELDIDTREPSHLQGISAPNRKHTFCLPCRRSRVRIPSAALEKACICRSFSLPAVRRAAPGPRFAGRRR